MTVQILDIAGTDNALTVDTDATNPHSVMIASAASIVSTVVKVEGQLAVTAKAWGASLFTLAFPADESKAIKLDTLIGDSKIAAGWATLTATDAGKEAKRKLEVYFSNARLVAESFESFSEDEQRDIRNGLVSIHYKAGLMRKATADAAKAAKKEEARLAAEKAASEASTDAAASASDVTATAPAPVSLVEMFANMTSAIESATDDELTGAYEAMAAMVAAYDARINASVEAVAA